MNLNKRCKKIKCLIDQINSDIENNTNGELHEHFDALKSSYKIFKNDIKNNKSQDELLRDIRKLQESTNFFVSQLETQPIAYLLTQRLDKIKVTIENKYINVCPNFVLGDDGNCIHHCGEYNEYARYVTFCYINGVSKACVDVHKYNKNIRYY